VLSGNARIKSGVILHFVLSFSYLIDNRKCWHLTPQLIPIILPVRVED